MPDIANLLLALAALGSLIALFLLLADSRRLAMARADLLWAFLRRSGTRREALVVRIGERGVRLAEMRCASCPSRGECLVLLADGAFSPAPGCTHATFFQKEGKP